MKYSKRILLVTSLAFAGCNSTNDVDADPATDDVTESVAEENAAVVSNEPEISITDEHGHGPDADSGEGTHSAAWQLLKQSEAFVQDGHSLEILSTKRLPGEAPVWVAEYAWQHHGDPDGDYSGLVRVIDGVPSFVETHGLYAPSCPMYEGETVELQYGSYTWDRFTDTRSIDDDGNLVDPFPDHPMTGSHKTSGANVSLKLAKDDDTKDYVLLPTADAEYLLSKSEYEKYMADGELPKCALQRSEKSPE